MQRPFGAAAVAGAALLTLFLPIIALIAALMIYSEQTSQARRKAVRDWALWSAAWLALGSVIAIAVFASATSGAARCRGGISLLTPPTYQSNDGVHWTATYQCEEGGTTTKSVPAGQVPGGG